MHIPRATYRLQFSKSFTLDNAVEVIPYLAHLGVSDLYASPVFNARPGSTHGYDVVDHNAMNPELGGTEAFDLLVRVLNEYSMSLLQDVVPNHMAFDKHNALLMDVLEKRDRSPYGDFFDIDWRHPYEALTGRVLAPFLGQFYATALEEGTIELVYDSQGLGIRYYEHRFPLSLNSYMRVFGRDGERLEDALGANSAEIVRYLGALYYLGDLANSSNPILDIDESTRAKRVLRDIYESNEVIRGHMDGCVTALNGSKGDPSSYDELDALLSEQYMRLSLWKVATEEVNYRRFFTINDLICLRVELPKVFDHIHSLAFKLTDKKSIAGLRIDHIDGLYDPETYLHRLRERCPKSYLTVEKILGLDEDLPPWPVQGTTGYDFLGQVTALFCDNRGRQPLTRLYGKITGENRTWGAVLAEKKRLIVGKHMAGNIDNLAHMLVHLAGEERYGRDITLYALRRALVQLVVYFPHYRSYVGTRGISDADKENLAVAFRRAREEFPDLAYEYEFIENSFGRAASEDPKAHSARECLMHFQQLTGPLMAKGGEDTAYYTYNRLISLNEVGGDPGRFGITPDQFHSFNQRHAKHWPHTQNTTATHDTKRGEDARLRVNVLSEMPAAWARLVKSWARLNRHHKTSQKGFLIPDANDEYHLYQVLVGVFPEDAEDPERWKEFVERIRAYMMKAVREAKVHTAWIKPDTEYEEACSSFVTGILDKSLSAEFLDELTTFSRTTAYYGRLHSLSQLLLKMTVPGVPDFYQGTESWDLSLVDPDNRRPVNFAARRRMLESLDKMVMSERVAACTELLRCAQDGRVKMFLTSVGLRSRQAAPDVFNEGEYLPLSSSGKFARNVVAFARRSPRGWAIVVTPRLLVSMVEPDRPPLGKEIWQGTTISIPAGAPSTWTDAVTGLKRALNGRTEVGELLDTFPAALLLSD
ncbi:MAG: malto-oligosyltrehalose synthase [Chitinivibrionales bacterium]|nr:malto-oligosyltrehalose synthase [Chitinivibrionales bacterium]MBD3355594.1 malto-oligosyltrehalose synthase [Chitinivibrionales bacterium]